MDRPTCRTCPYWEIYLASDPQRGGVCERRPPVIVPISDIEEGWKTVWPETGAQEGCGEHPDFPAFIASMRRSQPVTLDDLPIKAGDSLYWDESAKRYVHHPETSPTAPPSSPLTPPCEPSERAPTTAQADGLPE